MVRVASAAGGEDPTFEEAGSNEGCTARRLAHAWLRRGHRRISTLDLLGPGLTLLTGPEGPAWADAAAIETTFPLDVHALDRPAADAVGIGPKLSTSPAAI